MHGQSNEDMRQIARDAFANGMGKDETVAAFRRVVEAEWQARTDETARKLYSREDWEYGRDELQERADEIAKGDRAQDINEGRDDDDGCPGHPAGPSDPMGQTVYCDGSCQS
jgi:hypothetical protein